MADRKLTELTEATEVDLTDQLYAVVGETSNRITVETLRNALDTLLADNNLSELEDASVARTNLGLGTAAEADIVGTVSQSGGDPTGAVIERGSNSNGEYVRYADGTQICKTEKITMDYIANDRCSATWTFPAAFSDTSYSTSTALRGPLDTSTPIEITVNATPVRSHIGAVATGSRTASSVGIAVMRVSGLTNFETGDEMYAEVTATGRWF